KPSAERPTPPAPAAPIFMKSRRLIADTLIFSPLAIEILLAIARTLASSSCPVKWLSWTREQLLRGPRCALCERRTARGCRDRAARADRPGGAGAARAGARRCPYAG